MKNYLTRLLTLAVIFAVSFGGFYGCGDKDAKDTQEVSQEEVQKMEQQFKEFASNLDNQIKEVYNQMTDSYFRASISGLEVDYTKTADIEKKLNEMMSDSTTFNKLKEFKESGAIQDPLLQRWLGELYRSYLSKQLETEKLNKMTEMQSAIEQKYSKFRATVDGKEYNDNEVEEVLKNSTDSKKLRAVWEAHKEIGPLVADDIIELVKMRNAAARELGFENFHTMSLKLSDQDPEEISKLFDELDNLTRDAFADLKNEIDATLSKRLDIKPEEMRPWHYQNRYFQEAPQIYEVNLDKYYADQNIEKLTEDYFASQQLPIEAMVAKSSLYPQAGKNQHAYCIDIDRDTEDVRVLCNITPSARWMETMLHEFGHALYQKHVDQDLPWSLKTPAHIFTTEAIAMLYGRFATSPKWMNDMKVIDETTMNNIDETCAKILRLQQLVFSRWSQVMYRFEKSMYANPDQDLNKLWWDLVEEYQMVKRPEGRDMPDWATKIHIASSPCYYHNYHLGELLASQLYFKIKKDVLKVETDGALSFYGQPEAGAYLVENVFKPGARWQWNEMIERATGEKLTPKYYAEQFVK
ncbi:MAG: M2 family metallopeptidase [Candidatus Kapaibacterium sp.]